MTNVRKMVTLCDNIYACALCICVAQTYKSYSENMKMIEIIRPDVKKCYKTPTIRFVEMEECVMAAATTGGSDTNKKEGDGDFTGEERRTKRSSIIFDDTESE